MDYIQVNDINELYGSPRHFEEGQLAFATNDATTYCFNNGSWDSITTTNMRTDLNLYDLNKSLISQFSEISEYNKEKLKDYLKAVNNNISYFMLLCKDYNYYTIFHRNYPETINYNSFANEVISICEELGTIVSWEENIEGNDAIEIWIKVKDQPYAFYLFPYDAGIVECN